MTTFPNALTLKLEFKPPNATTLECTHRILPFFLVAFFGFPRFSRLEMKLPQ